MLSRLAYPKDLTVPRPQDAGPNFPFHLLFIKIFEPLESDSENSAQICYVRGNQSDCPNYCVASSCESG